MQTIDIQPIVAEAVSDGLCEYIYMMAGRTKLDCYQITRPRKVYKRKLYKLSKEDQ